MLLILTLLHGRPPAFISLATVRYFGEMALDRRNGLHLGVFLRRKY